MSKIIKFDKITDTRGELLPIEDLDLPFQIKRIYFISNIKKNATRAGHGHFKTINALLCIKGSYEIKINNGIENKILKMKDDGSLLILSPEDWHLMYNFSEDCIVCVISNSNYDKNDYFYDEPIIE